MKFKLNAGIIVFFCCLYYINAKSKRFDERHCLASVYNLKQQLAFCHGRFVCDYYHGHPFQCIEKDSICDGTLDCPGGEDEYNCPKKVTKCQLHEVKCPNSDKCAITCNEIPECDYGVDENNCKRKECGAPPALLFGTFSLLELGNSLKGARALLSCAEGYKIDGKPEIECLENMGKLSWTTDHGFCVLKVCGDLPTNVENGRFEISSGSGKVADCASLVCDIGFCLYPETLNFVSIICQSDGQWSAPGHGKCLSRRNLALGQAAEQSTTWPGQGGKRTADNAVDGIRTTAIWPDQDVRCTETRGDDTKPYWKVTLDDIYYIGSITVTNRFDNTAAIPERFNRITIKVGIDTAETVCATFTGPADPQVSQYTFICDSVIRGNVVKITKDTTANTILALCEVEVYTFQHRCNGLMANVIVP